MQPVGSPNTSYPAFQTEPSPSGAAAGPSTAPVEASGSAPKRPRSPSPEADPRGKANAQKERGRFLRKLALQASPSQPQPDSPSASESEDSSSESDFDDTPQQGEFLALELSNYTNFTTMPAVQALPETRLTQRANNGDSEVLEVLAGATKSIDVAATERKTVFTQAMNGCYAFALVTAGEEGMRNVTLSHHPSIGLSTLKQEIEELRPRIDCQGRKNAVIIVAPQGKDVAEEASNIRDLSDLANRMGASTPLLVRYTPGDNLETKGSAVILDIPASTSEEPYRYQAFSQIQRFDLGLIADTPQIGSTQEML